jgi:hypothetical protein
LTATESDATSRRPAIPQFGVLSDMLAASAGRDFDLDQISGGERVASIPA